MTRILTTLVLIVSLIPELSAQRSVKALPPSLQLPALKSTVSTASFPEVILSMPAYEPYSESEDQFRPRYSVYKDTIIEVKQTAKVDHLAGKGSIWRLSFMCREAKSVQIVFSKFRIPKGSQLFLYDEGMDRIAGAFTSANNRDDLLFAIADFKESRVILEYYEPVNSEFEGILEIGSFGLGFSEPLFTEAGPGFINVNCPIGKDAQLAKHAVCKMTFKSGSYGVTCSGALINNTRNDGTPYFLTANHCMTTQAEAATLTTYFNYENAGCDGAIGESLTLYGAELLATGAPSDFTFLKLKENPPPEYQPYYAGWNVQDKPVKGAMGIHVPYNETKKISLEYDSIYSNPVRVEWDDNSTSPVGSHWIVGFDDGGTSQGSSGSPLFNMNNQVIGQLHGGDDIQAFYGKLSYSYTHKEPGYHTMRHYLDPDSTGIMIIDGYTPTDNVPDAFFTTLRDVVCHNTPIAFTDKSVFSPYEREWSVFPATHVFTDGTDKSSENPIIEFQQDTIYSVTLNLLRDEQVVSAETLNISSGPEIKIDVISEKGVDICDCDFESFSITAHGGDSYTWKIPEGDEIKIAISDTTGNSITVFRNPAYIANSTYQADLLVTGSQSTCSDTVLLNLTMLLQENDNIANAIELPYGKSDYYSNVCATVEENEPIPPYISCTTQNSWCDEYGTGEDIVENSVWFKFVASSTGRVSVSSTGMDNQIALYEADSHEAILNGDYTLLGANDDRTTSDYRPLIKEASVIPGKMYWIQVDGSGGGIEDDFYMTITELKATPVNDIKNGKIRVYPQPAGENVFLYHPDWVNENTVTAKIVNTAGSLVIQGDHNVSDGTVSVQLDGLAPGYYIFTAETRNGRYTAQIVKR